MDRRFEGQLVVVTGGGSGIGAACIERFSAEGATCVSLDATDTERPVDVREEAAVDAFFADLPSAPDVLVNAAGVGALTRVVDCSLEEWRRVLGINLDGSFLCLRAAARRMIADGEPGTIVNVASINQSWVLNGFGAYCASKAGVEVLTRVAALELAPVGIRVNAVAPGPIDTPLTKAMVDLPALNDAVKERTPYKSRFGTAPEVAAVVAFLASDDGRWIVGQSVVVDGGQLLVGEPDFLKILERDGLFADSLTPLTKPD